jgi:predicted DNA-binding protein with PD1-like motif
MQGKLISDGPERTFALVFERGDEVMSALHVFIVEHAVHAARFSAIGAFERAEVAWFDWQRKVYEPISVAEQVEVLSLNGDVAMDGAKPRAHAHVVLGRRGGATVGGHLMEAVVRPTLEVVLVDSPGHLRRVFDPESGIALIRPEAR